MTFVSTILASMPASVARVVASYIRANWIDADLVCAVMRPTVVHRVLAGAKDRCQECLGAFKWPFTAINALACGCTYHNMCFHFEARALRDNNDHESRCRQRGVRCV